MGSTQILVPPLESPNGYTHAVIARGTRMLFVAGQVGMDSKGQLPSDMVAQFHRCLVRIETVLRTAGAHPSELTRLTVYTTDMATYKDKSRELGMVYRRCFGRRYVPMSVVGVSCLYEGDALVEVEATAVMP